MIHNFLHRAVAYSTFTIGRFLCWWVIATDREVKRRLLIVRTDRMGDIILFAGALRYIRLHHPYYEISIVVDKEFRPLLANCPFVDRIIAVNKRSLKRNIIHRHLFLLYIYTKKFMVCLNPMYSRELITDEIALWSAAPRRVGWDSGHANMTSEEDARVNRVYTKTVFHRTENKPVVHELVNNRAFLEAIGIQVSELLPQVFPLYTATSSSQTKGYAVVAIESAERYKVWPKAKFEALIEGLAKKTRVVIVGKAVRTVFHEGYYGPGPLSWDFYRHDNTHNLVNETTIDELMNVVKHATLVIGNDTGVIHMASALGVRSVCIVGGGQFGRFIPYPQANGLVAPVPVLHPMDCFNCNWKCIYESADGEYPCVSEIPVSDVEQAVEQIMKDN